MLPVQKQQKNNTWVKLATCVISDSSIYSAVPHISNNENIRFFHCGGSSMYSKANKN